MTTELALEAPLLLCAARFAVSSRMPMRANPRRGMADLGDREWPADRRCEPSEPPRPAPPRVRWVLPASVGAVVVVGGLVARAATAVL